MTIALFFHLFLQAVPPVQTVVEEATHLDILNLLLNGLTLGVVGAAVKWLLDRAKRFVGIFEKLDKLFSDMNDFRNELNTFRTEIMDTKKREVEILDRVHKVERAITKMDNILNKLVGDVDKLPK